MSPPRRFSLPAALLAIGLLLAVPALARADFVTTDIVHATDPGKSTAVVTYALPIVTDDGAIGATSVCMPAPGSTFPLGVTTVQCSGDAMRFCAPVVDPGCIGTFITVPETGSFTVTVEDAEAPALTQPADVTKTARRGAKGASVTYPLPSASDNVGVTQRACNPPSGTFFAIGTTAVTCTARDAAGNSRSKTFTVRVRKPPVRCVVPNLVGSKLKRAKRKLSTAHCKLGDVTRRSSRHHKKRVVSQSPSAGAKRRGGFAVDVVVGK